MCHVPYTGFKVFSFITAEGIRDLSASSNFNKRFIADIAEVISFPVKDLQNQFVFGDCVLKITVCGILDLNNPFSFFI